MPSKTCTKCKESYPAKRKFFSRIETGQLAVCRDLLGKSAQRTAAVQHKFAGTK